MFTRPIVASSLKATAAPAAAGHGRELVRVAIGVVALIAVVWLVLELLR